MVEVWGKKSTVYHRLIANRDSKNALTEKPYIAKITETEPYHIIDAEVPPQSTTIEVNGQLAKICEWKFNADKLTPVVITNYVHVVNQGEKVANEDLHFALEEWNEQQINKSDRLKTWCKLLGKEPKDVCYEDLCLVLGITLIDPKDVISLYTQSFKIEGTSSISSTALQSGQLSVGF